MSYELIKALPTDDGLLERPPPYHASDKTPQEKELESLYKMTASFGLPPVNSINLSDMAFHLTDCDEDQSKEFNELSRARTEAVLGP